LEGQEDVWGNIERVEAYGISVLPAGHSPGASVDEDLEPYLQNLGDTLSKLRGKYRYILVDSPPLVPYRDSNIIARVTDGVIFVVEANVTRAQVLDFALRRMQTVEAKILGLVLNKREFRIPNWLYRYL
jgi:tyrosine-protein kinase Etk/Wzc